MTMTIARGNSRGGYLDARRFIVQVPTNGSLAANANDALKTRMNSGAKIFMSNLSSQGESKRSQKIEYRLLIVLGHIVEQLDHSIRF